MYLRMTSASIRALTLCCRLLLIVLLARYLPPEDVGLFGLFFVTANLGLIIAGFDFYAYSNRELIDASPARKSQILFNQLMFHVLCYVLLVAAAAGVFLLQLLPWQYFGFFVVITVLEHLSYESYRLFVILGRPLVAGLVSFFRGGLWVLMLPLVFSLRSDWQNLTIVFWLWTFGLLACASYSVYELRRSGFGFATVSLDIQWIKTGMRVALPLFFGTLAIRSLFTFDRYLVEALASLALVGVYTFYIGLCIAMLGVVDASVFSFTNPKLLSAAKRSEPEEFTAIYTTLAWQTVGFTIILSLVIYGLRMPMLMLAGNELYMQHSAMLGYMLIAFCLFTFSHVPNYGLYALKADKTILVCNLIAIGVFLGYVMLCYLRGADSLTVPEAMILAFASLLCSKSIFMYRIKTGSFTA